MIRTDAVGAGLMTAAIEVDEVFVDGKLVSSVQFFDDGTAVETVDGVVSTPRPMTDDERARFTPAPESAEERLTVLVDALATATTLAQVRAAAKTAQA